MQEIAASLSGKTQKHDLSAIKKNLDEEIEQKGLSQNVRTELSTDGLRISLNSGVMFETASSKINNTRSTSQLQIDLSGKCEISSQNDDRRAS